MDFAFFLNSVLLGVGLAMDAFSVSLANGLNEPQMKRRRMCLIAGVFAFFQFLMPMLGWLCVHTILNLFTSFIKLIPWIALALLAFIGGKMIYEGIKGGQQNEAGAGTLLMQGIATSIDALSVGFTIGEYNLSMALVSSFVIAAVTYIICRAGVVLGKKCGTRLSGKASILGGVILVIIGIEIFVKGVF